MAYLSLQRRHNECDCVSNHRRLHCLLNRLFRHRSKKTSKLCVTGLCGGNPSVTGGFPSQLASNEESVSIWWRHHDNCSLRFIHTNVIEIISFSGKTYSMEIGTHLSIGLSYTQAIKSRHEICPPGNHFGCNLFNGNPHSRVVYLICVIYFIVDVCIDMNTFCSDKPIQMFEFGCFDLIYAITKRPCWTLLFYIIIFLVINITICQFFVTSYVMPKTSCHGHNSRITDRLSVVSSLKGQVMRSFDGFVVVG